MATSSALAAFEVAGDDLADGGAGGAGRLVGGPQQPRLDARWPPRPAAPRWRPSPRRLAQGAEVDDPRAARAAAQGRRDGVGGALQVGFGEVVGVRVVGAVAAREPHPEARLAAARGALDAPVFERESERAAVFDEDLGEVAAVAQGAADGGVEQVRGEVVELHQVVVPRCRGSRKRNVLYHAHDGAGDGPKPVGRTPPAAAGPVSRTGSAGGSGRRPG